MRMHAEEIRSAAEAVAAEFGLARCRLVHLASRHNDIFRVDLDNIIFHRGRPSPIDFDEFGKGYHLFDLAELIRTSINADNWRERKELAISAYTACREVD